MCLIEPRVGLVSDCTTRASSLVPSGPFCEVLLLDSSSESLRAGASSGSDCIGDDSTWAGSSPGLGICAIGLQVTFVRAVIGVSMGLMELTDEFAV